MMRFYDIDIATAYGIEAGVLYQHFLFWIQQNKANGRNYREGRFWTYNSRRALLELFPEITEKKMRNAIDKLVEAGILMRGCFNKNKYDKTTWFAFVEEPLDLQKIKRGTVRDEDGDVILPAENEDSGKNSRTETVEKSEGGWDYRANQSDYRANHSDYKANQSASASNLYQIFKPNIDSDARADASDSPSLEEVDYENFCKDYLDYFAKITARTYSDINLLLKKEIDRQDFKTMFENALFLKQSGYHWRKGMEMIYKDLGDAETPMHAYFNFRDELRLLLRDDAELVKARVNKSKKQTLDKGDGKLEQFKSEEEKQEFEAWLREAFKDSNYDYDDVSRRIENARKKISEDDRQALFKKLGDAYKLE